MFLFDSVCLVFGFCALCCWYLFVLGNCFPVYGDVPDECEEYIHFVPCIPRELCAYAFDIAHKSSDKKRCYS